MAAYNKDAPVLSETVTVRRFGDELAFMWSWSKRIGHASDPDTAAHAIAYVLAAVDVLLGAK